MLWNKYKKLSSNKSIHAFWVSNGSIRLHIGENDRHNITTHLSNLEELFPGNKDFSNENFGALYAHFFHIYILIGLFGYVFICWV